MLKKTTFIFIAIALSFSSMLFAKAGNTKIGTVNYQKIFSELPQRKAIVNKIKKQFKARSNQLKSLAKKIETKRKKAEKNAMTMTQEKKIAVQRELQNMAIKAQTLQKNLQEDLQRAQQLEGQKLQNKINATINKIAKAEQFDLILRSEMVAYKKNSFDISNKVITILGKK
jgi:outer membrane protein